MSRSYTALRDARTAALLSTPRARAWAAARAARLGAPVPACPCNDGYGCGMPLGYCATPAPVAIDHDADLASDETFATVCDARRDAFVDAIDCDAAVTP